MRKNDVFVEAGRDCDKAQKLIDLLYRKSHIGMYRCQPVNTPAVDFNTDLTGIDSDYPRSGHPSTTQSHANLKESPTRNNFVHLDRAAAVVQASKATPNNRHYMTRTARRTMTTPRHSHPARPPNIPRMMMTTQAMMH